LPTAYRGAIETRRSKLAPTSDLSFAQWRNAYWRRVDRNEPEDIAYLKGLYDSEIREMDAALGRLFAGLRRVAPNAVIVLTSDHGEQFGEHGGFLHNDLYEELLRVPLLLSYPGMQAGLSIPTPVSLIDLAPTLVELVGLEAAAQFQGASLLGVVNGKRDATPIFSEKAGVRHSLVLEGVKTIQRQRKVEVYDLFRDPSELLPLGDRDPRARNVATELARTLDTNQRARQRLEVTTDAQPQPGALPSRAIEQLRALGYAQ
jgi:arylsulfatase A-like enzyme